MDWPKVRVIIVTYDRPREIRKTIYALLKKIKYSGELLWHIADDNSPSSYIQDLKQEFHYLNLSATATDREGWGANVNKALQHVREDYIFLCEDDYVALKDVNLNSGIAILKQERDVGIVRYDGLTGHINMNLWIRESKTQERTVPFLEIDLQKSGHLNVYSNRPHLRHRRLHDKLGLYKEGLPLGQTEENYAHRVKENKHGIKVVCLNDGIVRGFEHIGKSRQGTSQDVGFR